MNITTEERDYLIQAPKMILKKPRKLFQNVNGCRRNDFTARSEDDEQFSIFLRQNMMLGEDFSMGLRWKCREAEREIILCRFNGPHGGNRAIPMHFVPHIHLLNIEDAQEDLFHENDVHETERYHTFEEAIPLFLEYCGLKDAASYFPSAYETVLF